MSAFERRRMFGRGDREPQRRSRGGYGMLQALVVVALVLLIASRANPSVVEPVREAVLAVTSPIIQSVSGTLQPIAVAIGRHVDTWTRPAPPPEASLRDQLTELQARVTALARENAALRDLVPVATTRRYPTTVAAVIGGSAGPVSHTLLIAAGRDQGIRAGFPVVVGDRLVGRVLHAHAATATVLRPSDRLSRIPVLVGSGQVRAILVGAGDGTAVLELVGAGAAPGIGDVIITSGIGGVFPRGLIAGTLASTGTTWRVDLERPDDLPAMVAVLEIEGAMIDGADQVRTDGAATKGGSGPVSGGASGGTSAGQMRPASGPTAAPGERTR
jgi:rod shape-determining protein MreC